MFSYYSERERSDLFNHLLSDDDAPEKLKKKYWWIFKQDNSIGFLDKNQYHQKLHNFDIIWLDKKFCTMRDDYTFNSEREKGIMRGVFQTKLNRSLGTTNVNFNERILLNTQFREERHLRGEPMANKSFWQKLFSKRHNERRDQVERDVREMNPTQVEIIEDRD